MNMSCTVVIPMMNLPSATRTERGAQPAREDHRGQREPQDKLVEPFDLPPVDDLAPAREVAESDHREDGDQDREDVDDAHAGTLQRAATRPRRAMAARIRLVPRP